MIQRDPFSAIADPTRRLIIDALKDEPLTLNQIALNFTDITRQAVGKQVKYLEESGLIKIEKVGRQRICYLRLQELTKVNNWLHQYEGFWNNKLENLDNYLNQKNK